MKKLLCLCLSLMMCLSLTIPVMAEDEEPSPWDCIEMLVDEDDVRLYKDDAVFVIGNPYNYYVTETTGNSVYALREGSELTIKNTGCPYGIYIYFDVLKLGEGSITTWEWDEELGEEYEVALDITGKYYGSGGIQFLATEYFSWSDYTPIGDGLYWMSDFSVSGYEDYIFMLQPGESYSFTLPDNSPDTLYRVFAEYYNSDEDYYYWKYLYCVVDNGLFELSTPLENEEESNPFTDVPADAYYHDAVLWAYENNITKGVSDTEFGPEQTCTRGQVVTFLWRAKGCPEPVSSTNPFTDVKETDYYYKAVLWAVENGITNGMTATTFGPKETCSSAHVVTFLWRANGEPEATGESALAAAYPGQWYTKAVAWAETAGLLEISDLAFAPKNNSPRGDIVTYLYLNMAN